MDSYISSAKISDNSQCHHINIRSTSVGFVDQHLQSFSAVPEDCSEATDDLFDNSVASSDSITTMASVIELLLPSGPSSNKDPKPHNITRLCESDWTPSPQCDSQYEYVYVGMIRVRIDTAELMDNNNTLSLISPLSQSLPLSHSTDCNCEVCHH